MRNTVRISSIILSASAFADNGLPLLSSSFVSRFSQRTTPFCFRAYLFSSLKTAPPPVEIIIPLLFPTCAVILLSISLKYLKFQEVRLYV